MARRNYSDSRTPSGRMDPRVAENMMGQQSPFSGMFGEQSASNSPGGGGVPFLGSNNVVSTEPMVNTAIGGSGSGGGLFGMSNLELAMLGIGGVNSLRGMLGGDDNSAGPFDRELRELLQMQTGRMRQSEPLYQAIMQLAQHLMPRGGGMPTPPAQTPGTGARPRMF